MDRSEILEIILDHYQNPRNYGEMEESGYFAAGWEPRLW
jgi:NifU-like protein involved in Fe-S cluster formation